MTLAALGVAIGKLLLRWGEMNDTADALQDVWAGFGALRTLTGKKVENPVAAAITGLLEQRLVGVRDPERHQDMAIAVANVADLFTRLSDNDIRAAAQHPDGFPSYVVAGPGRTLLAHTEQAFTPFTAELISAGAEVFAELAPRSGRFAPAALVRLLNQVDAALTGMDDLRQQITAARDELLAAQHRVVERVEELRPKLDEILRMLGQPECAVQASRQATHAGHAVGDPIRAWDPGLLGVHASITVHDETTLTPYLARDHDQQLRQVLEHAAASEQPSLVLVVGTSCSGKTRTLYEAVTAVLPDWAVIAPRSDSRLAQALLDGIPAHTVIWLDELQDRLPAAPFGITAAKAINDLLDADVGPIVVAGTLWPRYLSAMRARPDPDQTRAGAGAIPDLLTHATVITVPENFTDNDLDHVATNDPRLQLAIHTATHTEHPKHGRKITQVLAGGTRLLNRLYPEGPPPGDEFSPAARAVLHAAGDLRRVGHPNPLPRWAIDGAAPGYLTPPDHRPPDHWLPAALAEVTQAARHDDTLTGDHSHDHHTHGIPALTPHWTATPTGDPFEAYDLHDYLLEDHLARHRRTPASPHVWATLTTEAHPPEVARVLARSAKSRGLFQITTALLLPHWRPDQQRSDDDDHLSGFLEQHLEDRLAHGDDAAVVLLRQLAEGSATARCALTNYLGRHAATGCESAWFELRQRARAGETRALEELCDLLLSRAEGGVREALDELRAWAEEPPSIEGVSAPRRHLVELLSGRSMWDSRAELELTTLHDRWGSLDYWFNEDFLYDEGEVFGRDDGLAERALIGDSRAFEELEDADRGQVGVLQELAGADVAAARAEIERRASEGDGRARAVTAKWLAIRAGVGDGNALEALRQRAKDGDDDPAATYWLLRLLELDPERGIDAHQDLSEITSGHWEREYASFLAKGAREGDEHLMERLRALTGPDGSQALADLLADRAEADDSSLAELIGMVHQGLAGSAEALIRAYQRRNRPNFVIALDPHANPILGKSEWQG